MDGRRPSLTGFFRLLFTRWIDDRIQRIFRDTIKLWRASDGTMIRTFGNISAGQFIFGPMEPITFFPMAKPSLR